MGAYIDLPAEKREFWKIKSWMMGSSIDSEEYNIVTTVCGAST